MYSFFPNIKKRTFNRSLLNLCSILGVASLSCSTIADTKIVGYIPSYKDMVGVANATDFKKITHLNLAFLSPNSSGVVASNGNPVCMDGVTASDITFVAQKAHDAGAKVLISLAGAAIPSCGGDWAVLLQPANRTKVVNNLIQFVNTLNLDGIDVDIEGDLLTKIDNAGNYTPFIQALKNGLGANKLVTSATGSYEGGMVPIASLPYFDFVNIMSYDNIGPNWGESGDEHAPYSMSVSDINIWKARGLPKEKIVLGLPAYGYGFNGFASDYDYNAIIAQFGASAAQNDVISTRCAGCSYITYNGLPTIRKKTSLALQQGGGVMIWELAADTHDATSILSAVYTTISATASSSSTGAASSASSSIASTTTIQAENYSNMNGIQTEATSDTGGGSNVGYIDANDWLTYNNVNIPAAGKYTIAYRVASLSGGGSLQFEQAGGGTIYGSVTIPSTGGWQNWTTIYQTVTLNAGTQSFGIKALAGGWNINWFSVTPLANSSSSKSISSAVSSIAVSSIASSKSSASVSSASSKSVASSVKSSSSLSSASSKSSSKASSSSIASGGVNLDNAVKKDIAMQIVSSAENSTTNWRGQFAYIEDIDDGRGYTAGIIGFCSGTGDMLELVQNYTNNFPSNGLAKYLPALRKVNNTASHTGLDPNYQADWKKEAQTASFQAAQETERDNIYFNPSVAIGKSDGIRALGQFAYYDAAVVHGYDGMLSVRARAMKKAKTPAQGGNEVTYLNAFLDERVVEMKKEAAHEDTSRIDTAQRVFLNNGNLDLNTPLNWKVYGDSFSIK